MAQMKLALLAGLMAVICIATTVMLVTVAYDVSASDSQFKSYSWK